MQLIGITALASDGGTARVGKDAAADLLAKDGYRRLAFADPLYSAFQVLLGLSEAEMVQYREHKDMHIPRYGASLREILQQLGDWAAGVFGQEWAISALSRGLAESMSSEIPGMLPRGYVVPDVRAEHEAAWIRDMGGLLIHLEGPRRSHVAASGVQHWTEGGITFRPGRDVLIRNDGTMPELHMKLRAAVMAAGDAA